MKEVLKKALFLSALGCILGMTIGVVFWIIGDPNALKEDSISNLIVYIVVSGLYGMVAMGASAVYDIEQWSIARATLVHFIVTLAGFYILGLVEGWLTFGDAIFYIMTAAFLIIYFIIWLIQYMSVKHMVNNLNRDLEKMKSPEEDV